MRYDGDMPDRSYAEYKNELLSQGVEDLCGVHEALWTANTWYPDRPVSERVRSAEQALAELLDEGLIVLYCGGQGDLEEEPVTSNKGGGLLREWNTWAIPSGPTVFFSATDLGQRAYYSLGRDE